ncbi:hypothetical protein ON010_g18620 [Phytophthora cinnamomi]|nr:hypothetical protein ON010_g18620 [Phytophthora cinnamomi]
MHPLKYEFIKVRSQNCPFWNWALNREKIGMDLSRAGTTIGKDNEVSVCVVRWGHYNLFTRLNVKGRVLRARKRGELNYMLAAIGFEKDNDSDEDYEVEEDDGEDEDDRTNSFKSDEEDTTSARTVSGCLM